MTRLHALVVAAVSLSLGITPASAPESTVPGLSHITLRDGALGASATPHAGIANVMGQRGMPLSQLAGTDVVGPAEEVVNEFGSLERMLRIVAPAFHGLEPQLGIRYQSAHGQNGILGPGWALTGVSSVERQSPGHGVPTFEETDEFRLNGLLLMPCRAELKSPSCVYRVPQEDAFASEIETFRRISFRADPRGGVWNVWSKDGTKSSHQSVSISPTKPTHWAVTHVADTLGNVASYTHSFDDRAGERLASYLTEVAYGPNRLRLRYEPRRDAVVRGDGSHILEMRYRLRSIEVYGGEGLARVYDIGYVYSEETGRSLLHTVREYGRDAASCSEPPAPSPRWVCQTNHQYGGSALPSNTFTAPSMLPSSQPAVVSNVAAASGANVNLGKPWSAKRYGDTRYRRTTPWIMPSATSFQPRYRVADVNGDGLDDVLKLRLETADDIDYQVLGTALASRHGYSLHDFEPDPSRIDPDLGIHEDFLVGDVDGDSRDDLVQITNSARLQVWRSKGDGSFSRTVDQSIGWPFDATMASCFSFNVSVAIGLPLLAASASWNVYQNCDINLDSHYFMGDINGDGQSDLLGVSQAPNETIRIHKALSRGNHFEVLPDRGTPWKWTDTNTKKSRFFPSDVNGDGLVDIVAVSFHRGGESGDAFDYDHAAINIGLSRGDGTFALSAHEPGTRWNDQDVWLPGDINGDGRIDIYHLSKGPGIKGLVHDHARIQVGVSEGVSPTLSWRSQNLHVPWFRPPPFLSLNQYPTPWLVGDVNGDGRSDVLGIAEWEGHDQQDVSALLAKEDMSFRVDNFFRDGIQPRGYLWKTPESVPVNLADLNGDGRKDLVLTPWKKSGRNYPTAIHGYLSPNTDLDHADWTAADVNGDGLVDYTYGYFLDPGYATYTLIARSNGTYLRIRSVMQPRTPSGVIATLTNPDNSLWERGEFGALGRSSPDARSDLAFVDQRSSNSLWLYVARSNGNGQWASVAVPLVNGSGATFPAGYTAKHWTAADVTGDGRDELLHTYHHDGRVYVHTVGLSADGRWRWSTAAFFDGLKSVDQSGWRLGDVNGDGRIDLVMATSSGLDVTLRTLMATGHMSWVAKESASQHGMLELKKQPAARDWMSVDANADGLTDFGFVEQVGFGIRLQYQLSTGAGGWRPQSTAFASVPPQFVQGGPRAFRPSDINGDGATDLVSVSFDRAKVPNGTSIVALVNGPWNWRTLIRERLAVNFADVVRWRALDSDSDGSHEVFRLDQRGLTRIQLVASPDRVGVVQSELGAVTTVDYRSARLWRGGISQAACRLPFGVPLHAVAAVRQHSRTGTGVAKSTLEYVCPRWSYRERGFIGWRQQKLNFTTATNNRPSTRATTFNVSERCRLRPVITALTKDSGEQLKRTEIAYEATGAMPPYQCGIHSTNDISTITDGKGVSNFTYFDYDGFGNAATVREIGDPNSSDDDRVSYLTYVAATGPYVVAALRSRQMHAGSSSTDPLVRSVLFCYDYDSTRDCSGEPARGLVTQVREHGSGDTAVSTFVYTGSGMLTSVVDAEGRRRSIRYASPSDTQPSGVCNPLNQCESMKWDATSGSLRQLVDRNGLATDYKYDAFGRLTEVKYPNGGRMTRGYLNWGNPQSQHIREVLDDESADGLWREVYLDGLGREYLERREGSLAGQLYSQARTFVGSTDLVAAESTWQQGPSPVLQEFSSYDEAGRQIARIHADGSTDHTMYASDGSRNIVVDQVAGGRARHATFDARGRLRTVSGSETPTASDLLRMEYNAADEVTLIDAPGPGRALFTWDIRGRNIGMRDTDRGTTVYHYDRVGNLEEVVDNLKRATRTEYDALDRPRERRYSDRRVVQFRYDEPGHGKSIGYLTSVLDTQDKRCRKRAVESYEYVEMGQVSTKVTCIDGHTSKSDSAFDTVGRATSITMPDGEIVKIGYDAAGRPASLSGYVKLLEYDAAGNPAVAHYSNGTEARWERDVRLRVTGSFVHGPGGQMYNMHYKYNSGGAIIATESTTNLANIAYVYDPMGRVTSVQGDQIRNIAYQANGNVSSTSSRGAYDYTGGCASRGARVECPHAVKSISMGSDGSAFSYDGAGNRTRETQYVSGKRVRTQELEWNSDNRASLIKVRGGGKVRYMYDVNGSQTLRIDGGERTAFFGPLSEVTYRGAKKPVKSTQYYSLGPLLVARKENGRRFWYHADHVGSIRLVTNEHGNVVARQDYDVFGLPIKPVSELLGSLQFAGQRAERGTTLMYLGSRYYDAAVGRFISPDRVMPQEPNSESLNPYSYANNDPVNMIDPRGTQACAPAQETCVSVAPPAAPPPPPASSNARAAAGRNDTSVHTQCSHCSFFTPPPEDSLTLEQAMNAGYLREGQVNGVTAAGLPIQADPVYDDTGVTMFGYFAGLAFVQASGLALYNGILAPFSSGLAGVSATRDAAVDVSARAAQIHNALLRSGARVQYAHQMRTTAVLEAVDSGGQRWYLVSSSGGQALTAQQRALLSWRELPVPILGNHAEINALLYAQRLGLRPVVMGASRAICPGCASTLGWEWHLLLDTPLKLLH